jgi:hypothetical protein
MNEKTPKTIGRRKMKNISPAAKSQYLVERGFSAEASKAASITEPRIKTAETSIIPVRIEVIAPNDRTLKLPDSAHRKKPSNSTGGGPTADDLWSIQFQGFIFLIKDNLVFYS